MKPYKGIVRISCTKKSGCACVSGKNTAPECLGCPDARVEVLDLKGETLYELKRAGRATGKPDAGKQKRAAL